MIHSWRDDLRGPTSIEDSGLTISRGHSARLGHVGHPDESIPGVPLVPRRLAPCGRDAPAGRRSRALPNRVSFGGCRPKQNERRGDRILFGRPSVSQFGRSVSADRERSERRGLVVWVRDYSIPLFTVNFCAAIARSAATGGGLTSGNKTMSLVGLLVAA